MAEIKKEVRSIGQRISGLQAGETYTFVLKRPKPTADLTNARRCIKLTTGYLETARLAVDELEPGRASGCWFWGWCPWD